MSAAAPDSDTTELILWERGLTDDAVQSLLTPTTTLLNLGRNKLRPRARRTLPLRAPLARDCCLTLKRPRSLAQPVSSHSHAR